MTEFPKTLAAARAVENSQWALGDALNEECELSKRTVHAAHDYLVANGMDAAKFSVDYLVALAVVSRNFPKNTRKTADQLASPEFPPVSWDAHHAAGNPETLDAAIKAFKPKGSKTPITRDQVREYRREQSSLPPRPARRPDLARPRVFAETEMWLFISSSIDKLNAGLEDVKVVIEDHVSELDQTSISALIEQLIGVSEQAREIVDGLRRHARDPRGHLSTIVGGAA